MCRKLKKEKSKRDGENISNTSYSATKDCLKPKHTDYPLQFFGFNRWKVRSWRVWWECRKLYFAQKCAFESYIDRKTLFRTHHTRHLLFCSKVRSYRFGTTSWYHFIWVNYPFKCPCLLHYNDLQYVSVFICTSDCFHFYYTIVWVCRITVVFFECEILAVGCFSNITRGWRWLFLCQDECETTVFATVDIDFLYKQDQLVTNGFNLTSFSHSISLLSPTHKCRSQSIWQLNKIYWNFTTCKLYPAQSPIL